MNIGERNKIQGPSTRDQGSHDYMKWENLIEDECKVKCSVVVMQKAISIRADDYRDFILAKELVSKRTGLEVVRG